MPNAVCSVLSLVTDTRTNEGITWSDYVLDDQDGDCSLGGGGSTTTSTYGGGGDV